MLLFRSLFQRTSSGLDAQRNGLKMLYATHPDFLHDPGPYALPTYSGTDAGTCGLDRSMRSMWLAPLLFLISSRPQESYFNSKRHPAPWITVSAEGRCGHSGGTSARHHEPERPSLRPQIYSATAGFSLRRNPDT